MLLILLGGASAFAQTTAQITGTVTVGQDPLPGATVTISSPNLQGTRTTTTNVNGNYNFAALPPGPYTVRFEMEGMQSITRRVEAGVLQTAHADASMKLTTVSQAITVTATAPAVLETTEVQTNTQQQLVNKLPMLRTVTAVALLAPGTTSTGPRNALVISGATADQNLIMVDGAVIQENLRGQPHGLFIEDAIQETTILTGAVSAEYGRFTGGVVNSITKSGGNEFHGSYRDTLDNPKWQERSDFGEPRGLDKVNQQHEATFGGRIIRDRLWFFGAGRKVKTTDIRDFARGGNGVTTFPVATDAKRYEGKLTGQITPKHTLVATYLNSPLKATNNCQLGCLDQATLDPSIQQGNNFYTGHYAGILSSQWLVEANYSRKTFQFIGFGGDSRDLIIGTPVLALTPAGAIIGTANAPYFCGICDNEKRNNNSWNVKSNYFWAPKGFGTHSFVVGYERWAESRFSNNYQSPTNFVLNTYTDPKRDAQGGVLLTLTKDVDSVDYYPILFPSLGSDLRSKSLFANDKWDLNAHWNFNIGVRYDKNDAVNSLHQPTSKDSNVSPRLGANYDIHGDGKYRLTASYSKYVGRLAEAVSGQSSPAGDPADFNFNYGGPTLTNLSPHDYVVKFFEWFNANGGIKNNDNLNGIFVGGFQTRLAGLLKSPNVREFTIGGGAQIGNGYFRLDYIDRDWKDFYVNVTNLSNGKVTEPTSGAVADLTLVTNTNDLKRTYKGIQSQAQYRLFNRVNIGGNYTYSKTRGNAVQENVGSGPISEGGFIFQYPEYQGFKQNDPVGFLGPDA